MNNSKNKGWVRLHRKIEENSLWFLEPFTKAQAWIDIFLNANHKDGIIQIRGNVVHIKRGQIGWSELTMCSRWKWSKNRTRRFLKLLESEQQIKQQKDRYITTIITILNYENYQSDTPDDTAEGQQKDSRRYSRRYINKNDKNDKNDNNSDIYKFWNLYPLKVQKKKAEVSWNRLSEANRVAALADIPLRKFKEGFIPHPTTYLNGERWNDEEIKTNKFGL